MNKIKSIFAILSLFAAFSLAAPAQSTILTSLDGEKIDVQANNGKVKILAVGASWLPLSKDQAVAAAKLSRKYAGQDVEIYFVMTDSTNPKSKNYASDEQIKAFATKNKLNVKILRDSDGILTLKKFGIDQIPSFAILDKTGKKSGDIFGGIDPNKDISIPISQAVDDLL